MFDACDGKVFFFFPALQSWFGSSGHIHLQQEGEMFFFYLKKERSRALQGRVLHLQERPSLTSQQTPAPK